MRELRTMLRMPGRNHGSGPRYPAAIFIVILSAVPLFPQEVAISIHPENRTYFIKLSVNNMKSDEILKSLYEGLRAEISHHIRIYRKATGILRFLGDRLVEESSPSIIARWDIFRRQYIIDDGTGRTTYCASTEDFLNAFFNSSTYTIKSDLSDPDSYYVLAQSNIRAVKIVPPFTILSSIFPLGAITTSWTRQDLGTVAGVSK